MSNPTLSTQIQLGKASIGKETASIGFSIDRSRIEVTDVDAMFVGARLKATFSQDQDVDQAKFEGMEGDTLESIVDVSSLSLKVETITGTFRFQKRSIDLHRVADFAQSQVLLDAERTGDAAPEEKPEAAEPECSGFIDNAPWRDQPLSAAGITGSVAKALEDNGQVTLGAIADWTAAGNSLDMINGIGEAKAKQIDDLTAVFFEKHPELCEDPEPAAV